MIGRDFQELSAEEQERQREEWKAELKKTEEEILTLKQVLTAKERHAAGDNITLFVIEVISEQGLWLNSREARAKWQICYKGSSSNLDTLLFIY